MLHAFLSFLLSIPACAAPTPGPLPKLRLDPAKTTVSGISSGAFMAIQLQVALSSRIHGAGSVAGGVYGCAEGNGAKAKLACMDYPGTLDAKKYVKIAKDEEHYGRIDPLANLAQARFYLFHSEEDATVRFSALKKLKEFVEAFVPARQIKVAIAKEGAHAFPTLDHGASCDTQGLPFIVACGRDVAGELLKQLYPEITRPAKKTSGEMLAFDQHLYAGPEAKVESVGYLYVPKACRTETCGLHIALHGCKMNSNFIHDEFREYAGYNRWADANRLVILYPEAEQSLLNPNGCWDWFGVTGVRYATREGHQIEFFAKLLTGLGL